MPERFSPEWIAVLDEAARAVIGVEDFVIQQVITDDQDTAWHVMLSSGPTRVRPGRAEAPDVTFTQDRATAEAIACGELSAGSALTNGRLIVQGATARLAKQREVLARLDAALAAAGVDA